MSAVVQPERRDTRKRRAVAVGDRAPDFTLLTQQGTPMMLSDVIGDKIIVLFFYPKDDTSGCTAEACSFRDSYEDFTAVGAEVIGVSSDSVASHVAFAAKNRLPYTLLSDEGGRVRALYGVSKTLGLLPGRVTYIIDRNGIVRHVFSSQLEVRRHVQEAQAMVREISRQ